MHARTYETVFGQPATADFPGGCVGTLHIHIYITGVPDEVLEEVIVILMPQDVTGGVDYVAAIYDKSLPIGRQLVEVNKFSVSEVPQCLVDLGIIRDAALP